MRFIGFIALAVFGRMLFGDNLGYYAVVVVAFFLLNPFGGSRKKTVAKPARARPAPSVAGRAPEPTAVSLPQSGIPPDSVFVEPTDGPPPGFSTARPLTVPHSLKKPDRPWKSMIAVVIGLAVIFWLVTRDQPLIDSGPAYSDSGDTVLDSNDDKVVGNVYEPADCEQNFPQLSDQQLIAQHGDEWGWRLRSAQVRAFCANEWDKQRVAEAAQVVEREGLLFWQWNDTARATADQMSPYLGFPSGFGDFAKVMDSGLVFVFSEAQLSQMRAANPRLPASEVIARVRKELRLDDNAVRSRPSPQRFTIQSKSPRVRFITDLGVSRSLEEAMQQTVLIAGSGYVQLNETYLNQLGTSMMNRGNLTAGLPAMQLEQVLPEAAEKRAMASSPLPDLDIYFLQNFADSVMQKLRGRPAMYDPVEGRIYVVNNKNAVEMMDSLRLDRQATLDLTLPAALWHEFDHYLYDDADVAESGFYIEGFATASGEHARRTMEAGAYATDEEEFIAIREEIAATESPTEEQRQRLIKAASDRIRKAPMTAMQCRYLALVHREYVTGGREIPIAQMLDLPPRMFQSKAYGNVALNYATAWAVLASIDDDEEQRQELRRVAAGVAANPLSQDDRRFLARLGASTKKWIRDTNRSRKSLCPE